MISYLKNQKNWIQILIGSGLIFALLYFSGYLYLLNYFSHFGSLIPFNELPSIEIALLGFLPLLIFSFVLIVIVFFVKMVLKIKWLLKFFTNLTRKYSNFIIIIFTIILIIFYTYWINIYSSIVFAKNLPYNFTVKFDTKLPVVEVIYTTPLINKQRIADMDAGLDTIDATDKIIVEDIKGGKIKFSRGDNKFDDNKFIDNFILYFISKDNYYLAFAGDPFGTYSEIIASGVAVNENKIEGDVNFGGLIVASPYKVIALPKSKVESVKYSVFNPDEKEIRYRDLY